MMAYYLAFEFSERSAYLSLSADDFSGNGFFAQPGC